MYTSKFIFKTNSYVSSLDLFVVFVFIPAFVLILLLECSIGNRSIC